MALRCTYDFSLQCIKTKSKDNPFDSDVRSTETIDASGSLRDTDTIATQVSWARAFDGVGGDSGGTQDIDLTSLENESSGTTQDWTGYALRFLKFKANADNAGNLTIAAHTSNGYAIGGETIVIEPGATVMKYFADNLSAISVSAYALRITGITSDYFDLHLVAG